MTTLVSPSHAQEISAEFPFESKYMTIAENKMHYIDEGEGEVILLLHGVPMSSYAWRNIIPKLSENNRCIAIDFMGFGKSDQVEMKLPFLDQYNYLLAFIDSLKLKNIKLVMTDIGGVLGTHYASKYPENVSDLIYMEAPFGDSRTFHKNGGMMQHMLFWMASKKKLGYRMLVKKNMMIKMMPFLIKRKLSKEEKHQYLAPFVEEKNRLQLFSMPNSFPRKGKNPQEHDMADFMNKNNAFLENSDIPKLVLYAKPGMLVNRKTLKWIEASLSHIETKMLGKAKHLMEEDLPLEIASSIQDWVLQKE